MTPRHRRRLGVLVGIVLILPTLGGVAGANPLDDKKAEAARIQHQLDAQGDRISALDERFNQAQLSLQRVQGSLNKAQAALQTSGQRLGTARSHMTHAAINAYTHGGATMMIAHLARSTGDNLIVRQQYLQVAAASDHAAIEEMRSARQDLDARQASLLKDEKAAAGAADRAGAARRAGMAAEAAQAALLGKVKGDLAGLVASEAAKQTAEAARKAQARLAAATLPSSPKVRDVLSSVVGPVVAPAKGAAGAVAMAEAQLGKPYVYGGSGPDVFDCSGLMMFAWRAAGVSLSHSAAAQYDETSRIPISALQPGDLLFFGSPIHHNAMYVGNGTMIEAPHTGLNVRYAPAFRPDLVGAGRVG